MLYKKGKYNHSITTGFSLWTLAGIHNHSNIHTEFIFWENGNDERREGNVFMGREDIRIFKYSSSLVEDNK